MTIPNFITVGYNLRTGKLGYTHIGYACDSCPKLTLGLMGEPFFVCSGCVWACKVDLHSIYSNRDLFFFLVRLYGIEVGWLAQVCMGVEGCSG